MIAMLLRYCHFGRRNPATVGGWTADEWAMERERLLR